MDLLRWMGDNFVLTVILAVILWKIAKAAFRTGRSQAWKCPQCGHRGAVPAGPVEE
jgi:hypothetical protein